jgi:hypothetical protein
VYYRAGINYLETLKVFRVSLIFRNPTPLPVLQTIYKIISLTLHSQILDK